MLSISIGTKEKRKVTFIINKMLKDEGDLLFYIRIIYLWKKYGKNSNPKKISMGFFCQRINYEIWKYSGIIGLKRLSAQKKIEALLGRLQKRDRRQRETPLFDTGKHPD
jgi:hypothetical protein